MARAQIACPTVFVAGITLLWCLAPGVVSATVARCEAVPQTGGYEPARSDCCQAAGLDCTGKASHGERNVIVAVMDDHGYCQNGFLGGRCVRDKACAQKVCTTDPSQACSDASECPTGGCGETPECNVEANCLAAEICAEGVCSPAAPCTGNFQCARGVGTCLAGTCSVSSAPCSMHSDCPASETCERNCELSGLPCSRDMDCNDVCQNGSCTLTPEPCSRNSDCPDSQSYECASGTAPLRLNDVSCRYREPGDLNWEYDRQSDLTEKGKQTVFTPRLDQLAREGAVFPRARSGGEICTTGRAAIMMGRWMRHRNGIAANGGNSVRECRDAPIGCSPDGGTPSECANFGVDCDKTHSIAWWLENHVPGDPLTIAAGKLHFANASVNSFEAAVQNSNEPSFGKFHCLDGSNCESALDAGLVPNEILCRSGCPERKRSVAEIMDEVDYEIVNDELDAPLFLWYAPVIPHAPGGTDYFDNLYGAGSLDDGQKHLSRTSWFDAGLEGLIDEFKNSCVCGPSGQPESLYDRTVVMVMPDHGYLMNRAKGGGGDAVENAHRHALIVNAPEHRNGQAAPRVFDETSQFAAAQDILPTVLSYAGVSNPDALDGYSLNTNLRPFVEGASQGLVRDVFYAHANDSGSFNGVSWKKAYMIPSPGVLGLCLTTNTPNLSHAQPCLTDADCPGEGTGSCDHAGKRCINDPTQRCTEDAECGSCGSGSTCDVDPLTSFAEFDGEPCADGADCVPEGSCRPAMLKIYQKGGEGTRFVSELYDLNWDPDQQSNLLKGTRDPDYLAPQDLGSDPECINPPSTLAQKMDCCMLEFMSLRSDNDLWCAENHECPAELRGGWVENTEPGCAASP